MAYGRRDSVNNTPTCHKCKIPMVAKKGRYGDFFGCRNFPRCKITSRTRFAVGNNELPSGKDPSILPGDFNTRKG